jgi:HEAT repeats
MKAPLRSSRPLLLAAFAASLLLSGCAIGMKVPIKDSAPSTAQYVKPAGAEPTSLYFTDARTAENKAQPVTGRIRMALTAPDGKPFDAIPWLAGTTVKELVARGLPVQLATAAGGPNTVTVRLLQIENRRVSGWSPFETFTSLKADVTTRKGTERIAAFIMRGKVPVWSFDEVIDPTYNDPLDLVAKELAAKLNQTLYGAKVSDAQVDALVARTSGANVNFRDVHELGFGNNARATNQLVNLSSSTDDNVMRAALSALGVLRAEQHFDLLARQAENTKSDWEDRATALKAIGDLGSPQSRAYLEKERARLDKLTDAEAVRTKGLISLYLD